jgi:hypothetical protein
MYKYSHDNFSLMRNRLENINCFQEIKNEKIYINPKVFCNRSEAHLENIHWVSLRSD